MNGTNGQPGPQGQAGPQGTAGQRGETGATGPQGDRGPAGQAGPADPTTTASYDDLEGTPCTLHDGTAGITKVSKGDRINGFEMGAVCITPDIYEPNDSEAAAAQISTTGGGIGATIDHPGDSDWFQLLLPQTMTDVHVFNAGGLANSDDFTAELYRDGALVATGQPNGSWPGVSLNYSRPADGQPHEWKLHVTAGHLAQYTLYAYG